MAGRRGASGTGFAERVPEEALGNAGLVEVLRDPAEEERPACAEEEGRVDISRLGGDALLEQAVDLVRDRLQGVAPDFLDGARRVLDDDDLLVAPGEVREGRREREAVGKGGV